ncbi:selenocysteine-specific translation elongation factor [Irregularibacter muris]|uniref:Selenocysteine-specific elongation factor n=1 Tax=Irregularibacter muris TaxID=1796619 RepID=A0AAE3L0F1_9FIRM|nr:selenocysteine-specific translation elongation factor [Irregularibacter muris]MCR1900241.1 selenocysteine-specific translation elongation factor [Irregularibacter muris]
MQNIIIGTAGHIDHGKTTLIKAITGKETDRLKEEKERGISIDLGFTYFDLPSGRRAGIVDVPGHEKFIKNMLAGVGGIDIVVLVVAADEGFMPQTQEHLNILSLLEVKKGIIALTKSDMVDEEWLEMVIEETKEQVKGTFLENTPIIPISSTKKIGIDELIEHIDQITVQVEERDKKVPFRLPIDRVFSITGFGTVVTGTLIEGTLQEGESIMLYPSQKETKVRNLQVHDKNVEKAEAGQRVAVNLSNFKKEQINRGDVLAKVDSLNTSMMIDVKLRLLSDSPFPIKNRERVRIYHGTSEILGRVVLLEQDELMPGQEGYAQLRLENQITAKTLDHFILRFYSPMVTIGGGIVLDTQPPKRKRFKEEVIGELKLKEQGESGEILKQFLKTYSKDFLTKEEIIKRIGLPSEELERIISSLASKDEIIQIAVGNMNYIFHPDFIHELGSKMRKYLQEFHNIQPLKSGVFKEEIRSRFFGEQKSKVIDELLGFLEEKEVIKIKEGIIALKEFNIRLTDSQKSIAEEIKEKFKKDGLTPPKPEEIWKDKGKTIEQYKQVFEALVEWEILVKVTEEIYIHKDIYDQIIVQLKKHFENYENIDVATFRDLAGTSRKYAIALLENFDQKKITKRLGDIRVMRK